MTMMSENINELMGALSKAQGAMDAASKDKTNPFFKSKYADMASVVAACRSALSENGLAVVQTIKKNADATMSLMTTLGHSSGQWIQSEMPIALKKDDPQSMGSALTYYRRYSLSAIVGVVTEEDDDGNAATAQYRKHEASQKTHEPQPKENQKLVSKEQAEQLRKLLDRCDPGHQQIAHDYIEKNYSGNLERMTLATYENFKTGCLKNIEQSKQYEQNHEAQKEQEQGVPF